MDTTLTMEWVVVAVALVAAVVNGALGYGFSSITVPVALGFYANRVLNPGLVVLEVGLNATSLFLNRKSVPAVWRQTLPIIAGLFPGVALGSVVLGAVAATPLKALTYAVLLPLILLQVSGRRFPIQHTRAAGLPFGAGLGVLYSTTTISGPPLALLFNNQGLAQDEFRAAISLVRVAESVLTLISYLILGLVTAQSLTLSVWLLPAVVVGLPLGRQLILRISKVWFGRVAMTVDAVLVTVGLSVALTQLGWVSNTVTSMTVAATAGFVAGMAWQRVVARRTTVVVTS